MHREILFTVKNSSLKVDSYMNPYRSENYVNYLCGVFCWTHSYVGSSTVFMKMRCQASWTKKKEVGTCIAPYLCLLSRQNELLSFPWSVSTGYQNYLVLPKSNFFFLMIFSILVSYHIDFCRGGIKIEQFYLFFGKWLLLLKGLFCLVIIWFEFC